MSEKFPNIRSKRIEKYVDPRDGKVKTIEIREARVEPATKPPIDMTDYGENFLEFRQRALDKAEFKTLKEQEARERKWAAHKAALDAIIRKYQKTKKLPEVGEPLDASELELQR